jgi:hypothetical protein
MREITNISDAPITKQGISELSEKLVSAVIDGDDDPIAQVVKLRSASDAIKKALDDDRVRESVITEVERNGGERTWQGVSVKVKETGARYDYSVCGDPVMKRFSEEMARLDAAVKERESFLKNVPSGTLFVDDETGEVYELRPALKRAKESFVVTFKSK